MRFTKDEKLDALSRIARMCMPAEYEDIHFRDALMLEAAPLLNVALKAIAESNKIEGHYAVEKKSFELTNKEDINNQIKDAAKKILALNDASDSEQEVIDADSEL